MSAAFPLKDPDILGFSPPLVRASGNKDILALYKEQAHTVVWLRHADPAITAFLDYLFLPSQNWRLRALDALSLPIQFLPDGVIKVKIDERDWGRSFGSFGIKDLSQPMPLTCFFPEANALSLVRDLEQGARDARHFITGARQFNLIFWTLTVPENYVFHCDVGYSLVRNYKNHYTEMGPDDAFVQAGRAAADKLFRCTDLNKIRSLPEYSVCIPQLDRPHRRGSSILPEQPKFSAAYYGYG